MPDNILGKRLEDLVIELRRDFHQYPELSGEERRTSAVIADCLRQLGIAFETYQTHCGVGGIISGGKPGPTIALRADMDALPIQEELDVPYKSANPGVMHACGHDAHMAMLLGAAAMLAKNRETLAGTVKLVFQPAEEAGPLGGARFILQEGFLDDVAAIFGLHVWPDLSTGHIGVKAGPLMAASDRFRIKILGKGAHAAQPHQGIDAITVGTAVMNSFNHIISRQKNPVDTATLSIGTIQGGERYNVIAKELVMEGTVRTLDEATRHDIQGQMKQMLAGIAHAYGANYELDYQLGYPVLNNWREPTRAVIAAARKVAGEKQVHTDIKPELGAEDFSTYLTRIPGAFFWLGCSPSGEKTAALHNSGFSMDEAALAVGAKLHYQIAVDTLSSWPRAGGDGIPS
jgi:amidohydrolase